MSGEALPAQLVPDRAPHIDRIRAVGLLSGFQVILAWIHVRPAVRASLVKELLWCNRATSSR
jgi:hypothetical protein